MSEMLGTLFKYLFALLGVGAVLAIVYSVVGANKTTTFVNQIAELSGNVQQLYAGTNTFATLANSVLVTAKAVPTAMVSGTSLIDPWGGAVTVSVNASNSGEFDISSSGVPNDTCARAGAAINTYAALSINGTTFTPPADPGNVAAQCNNGSNTVVFTFTN